MNPPRKNRLVMVFQDCGGVGKTDLSKLLGDWYAAKNHPVAIIDAEIAVKGAGRVNAYFPQAVKLDIETGKQFDDALLAAARAGTALCDVGANAGKILKAWLLEMGTEEQDNLDTDITLFVPITAPEPTAISLFDWIEGIQPNLVNIVVAKNEKDGTTFATYDKTNDGIAFQVKYSPQHIKIPRRNPEFEAQLVARRLTMLQAVTLYHAGELDLLGDVLRDPLTIGRIQRYSGVVMTELDRIETLIRP